LPIILPQTGKGFFKKKIASIKAIKLEELIDKYQMTKEDPSLLALRRDRDSGGIKQKK
jgi:hypothetical protein